MVHVPTGASYDCKINQPLSILCTKVYFATSLSATEEPRNLSYEGRIDHGLAVSAVSCRVGFCPGSQQQSYIFFIEPILSVAQR